MNGTAFTITEYIEIAMRYASVTSKFSKDKTGLQALADFLGVSKSAVSAVKKGRRAIPSRWCPLIEKITHRKVMCEDLRPDIEWSILREKD